MEKQCKIKKYIRDSNRLIKKKRDKKIRKALNHHFYRGQSARSVCLDNIYCFIILLHESCG